MSNLRRNVWKYDLTPGLNTFDAPAGARVLSAVYQRGRAVVYLLVNPDAPRARRQFASVPTGVDVDARIESFTFVGSVSTGGGSLWLHVFDGGEEAIPGAAMVTAGEA